MTYRLNMTRFLIYSIMVHFVFAAMSELVVDVTPPSAASPIKVSLVERKPVPNEDFLSGRIMELLKPLEDEEADEAEILTDFNSRARFPGSGKALKQKKFSIPQKKVEVIKQKAKMEPVKKPSTSPVKKNAETPKPAKYDKAVASNIPKPFKEKLIRPEDKLEKRSSRLEYEKIYERTEPTPLEPPEENSVDPERKPEPRKGGDILDGEKIDLFVRNNPHRILETEDEIVISLNTKKFKYHTYFTKIRHAVEGVWSYPDEAVINGLSGRSLLRFTLAKNGNLEEVKLVTTSGQKILDLASINAVEDAQPFAPFPDTLAKNKIHIIATFVYQPVFNPVR